MGAPMLKDGVAVGAILVGWPEAGHTTTHQIELVQDVRRPGRDRDRERAPVQRDQGGARAPDRDRRDPQGHRRSSRAKCSQYSTRSWRAATRLVGGHSAAPGAPRRRMHLVALTPSDSRGRRRVARSSGHRVGPVSARGAHRRRRDRAVADTEEPDPASDAVRERSVSGYRSMVSPRCFATASR